jgi:hypothetical protein
LTTFGGGRDRPVVIDGRGCSCNMEERVEGLRHRLMLEKDCRRQQCMAQNLVRGGGSRCPRPAKRCRQSVMHRCGPLGWRAMRGRATTADGGSVAPCSQTEEGREGWRSARCGQVEDKKRGVSSDRHWPDRNSDDSKLFKKNSN